MEKLNLKDVEQYVNTNIVRFHEDKLRILQRLRLTQVLKKKNPYLFRAKNITVASDLISDIMSAYLYSSEEKLFGDFLEDLAVFIAGKTCSGKKSAATGIDLEFFDDNTHYVVSIKSGPNWGNSSQQRRLETDLQNAVKETEAVKRHIEGRTGTRDLLW